MGITHMRAHTRTHTRTHTHTHTHNTRLYTEKIVERGRANILTHEPRHTPVCCHHRCHNRFCFQTVASPDCKISESITPCRITWKLHYITSRHHTTPRYAVPTTTPHHTTSIHVDKARTRLQLGRGTLSPSLTLAAFYMAPAIV